MRLPAAILLTATALVAPAFFAGPMPTTSQVVVRVLDINADGLVVAQLNPAPLAIVSPDREVQLGETFVCNLAGDHLECGAVNIKPLGFVVRGESPDLRVERENPNERSN